MFNRILVGQVDNELGADAVALGAALARLSGAELILAAVVPAFFVENLGERSGTPHVHTGARDRASAALEAAAEPLVGAPGLGGVAWRLEAARSAAEGLHDLAETERADLIVVGSSHHGGRGWVSIGSVGERLLHGAPCALAVAPNGYADTAAQGVREVGVAFDGSPESRGALRCGHALAAAAGARLRVMSVLEPLPEVLQRWVPLPGLEGQERIERARLVERRDQATADAAAAALGELPGGVDTHTDVLEGEDVAGELLRHAADHADLGVLVAGSRGYGALHRVTAGSVSAAILRAAPVPVIVVPRGAA